MNKFKTCLIEGCNKKIDARGLCRNHYAYAHNRIYKGTILSWEELEKKGMALPLRKRNNDLFDKAYKK